MKKFALVVVALVACSGSGASVDDGAPRDGGAATGDASASASADAGADVGVADARANDASAVDASKGDAGDDRIDPLAVGRTWTYQVTEVGSYPSCPSGMHDGAVVGEGARNGKHAFEVRSLCANVGNLYYAVAGDVVEWDDLGTWLLVLDAPVQDGHAWSNGLTTYKWHAAGTVTVPAGAFDRCFDAKDESGESFTTFCRGVGPIRWHYRDAMGNGYDATLTSKSF